MNAQQLLEEVYGSTQRAEEVASEVASHIQAWVCEMPPLTASLKTKAVILGRSTTIRQAIDELSVVADEILREMGWGYEDACGHFPKPTASPAPEERADAERALSNPEFKPLWTFYEWLRDNPYEEIEQCGGCIGPDGWDVGYLTGEASINQD